MTLRTRGKKNAKGSNDTNSEVNKASVIVIGGGPVGLRFVQEYINYNPNKSIHIFGDENSQNAVAYNRVLLSSYLAEQNTRQDLDLIIPYNSNADHHFGCRVKSIDVVNKSVRTVSGDDFFYDQLVISTGSKPKLPEVSGLELKGVYTFRTLNDADSLLKTKYEKSNIVILGGGVLGVETAIAIKSTSNSVTIINNSDTLLSKQINHKASQLLVKYLQSHNINVRLNQRVDEIIGENHVTKVLLSNHDELNCDALVLTAGTEPNVELAEQAGLKVNNGIVVDEYLQTSIKDVFAIGECSEYNGKLFGVVGPGYEQAKVTAKYLSGVKNLTYSGYTVGTRLKVAEINVYSLGDMKGVGSDVQFYEYTKSVDDQYRCVGIKDNKIKSLVIVGKCTDIHKFQEAFIGQYRISWWQLLRFRFAGSFWPGKEQADIKSWSPSTPVCHCTGVTLDTIDSAIRSGCVKFQQLVTTTGAGSVCGTCQPLLKELLNEDGGEIKPLLDRWKTPLLVCATIAFIILLSSLLLPGVAALSTVQNTWSIDYLLTNSFYKQVSGYSLLFFSLLGLMMSLRKRVKAFQLGSFQAWRFVHVALAVVILIILFLHTGFHLGDNLNRLLMINFLVLMMVGVLTAFMMSSASGDRMMQKYKQWALWSHILISWPLPVILTFHVLAFYYF